MTSENDAEFKRRRSIFDAGASGARADACTVLLKRLDGLAEVRQPCHGQLHISWAVRGLGNRVSHPVSSGQTPQCRVAMTSDRTYHDEQPLMRSDCLLQNLVHSQATPASFSVRVRVPASSEQRAQLPPSESSPWVLLYVTPTLRSGVCTWLGQQSAP
jgi:hypothetical protein